MLFIIFDGVSGISPLQMADPLTALMYAVQVMNFLKTLVMKTLKEREESMVESSPASNPNSFDDDGHQSSSQLNLRDDSENRNGQIEDEKEYVAQEPVLESPSHLVGDGLETENINPVGNRLLVDSCPCNFVSQVCSLTNGLLEGSFTGLKKGDQVYICKSKGLELSNLNTVKYSRKETELPVSRPTEKSQGTAIIQCINSRTELAEAWR